MFNDDAASDIYTWALVVPRGDRPSPRHSAAFTAVEGVCFSAGFYDTDVVQMLVLIGGEDASSKLNDMYRFDLSMFRTNTGIGD